MNTYFAKAKKKGHKRVEESFSISSIDDTTMLLHFFQTPKIPGTFSDFLIQLEATTIEYTMSNVEWYSHPPLGAPRRTPHCGGGDVGGGGGLVVVTRHVRGGTSESSL